MSAVGDKMGPSERRLNDSQIPYRTLLAILTALFAFRVLMQPLVWKWPIKMLPSFDQWHSEAMPYGVLLSFLSFSAEASLSFVALGDWGGHDDIRPTSADPTCL